MDLFSDEASNQEKHIEDYLFSGYRTDETHKSTSNADQQFAKPIEDEDMFGLADSVVESESPKPKQLRQKIREQVLAKGRVAKPISCKDKDGLIDLDIIDASSVRDRLEEQAAAEPTNKARLIFKHAEERRVKDKYGLYKGQKLTLSVYENYIKKKICSDKRKQWDSFQNPPDLYDDEEQILDS